MGGADAGPELASAVPGSGFTVAFSHGLCLLAGAADPVGLVGA